MTHFWEDYGSLLILLGSLTIPLAVIAMGAFNTWLHYHSRNRALEALRVYAERGKEPPAELLRAVESDRHWTSGWRADRWPSREPIRRWNNAIFLVMGSGALYFAARHYAADHLLSDRLYVGAIIVGALAAAAVLRAILATMFRP